MLRIVASGEREDPPPEAAQPSLPLTMKFKEDRPFGTPEAVERKPLELVNR